MYSQGHAILSAILAIGLIPIVSPPIDPFLLFAYVLMLGVGIDIDHFPIARINVGNWSRLGKVVENPNLMFNQSAIFEPDDVTSKQRLYSHTVITVLVVGIFVILDLKTWAGVSASTLILHIVTDMISDITSSS